MTTPFESKIKTKSCPILYTFAISPTLIRRPLSLAALSFLNNTKYYPIKRFFTFSNHSNKILPFNFGQFCLLIHFTPKKNYFKTEPYQKIKTNITKNIPLQYLSQFNKKKKKKQKNPIPLQPLPPKRTRLKQRFCLLGSIKQTSAL